MIQNVHSAMKLKKKTIQRWQFRKSNTNNHFVHLTEWKWKNHNVSVTFLLGNVKKSNPSAQEKRAIWMKIQMAKESSGKIHSTPCTISFVSENDYCHLVFTDILTLYKFCCFCSGVFFFAIHFLQADDLHQRRSHLVIL